MNAYEWLGQVKTLDQLIDAKIAERDRLIQIATDISPRPMDGMPHSDTGVVSRKIEDAVLKLVDLEQEINRLIDQYVDCRQQVIKTLEQLPAKEYGVLHRHWIRGMSWSAVAEDMGYSTMQVWRIKKNGLKILQEVIECYTKK